MIVSEVVMVEREPYSKIGRTHCRFVVWWMGWVLIFCWLKSDSVVPGVAAQQDVLKVFFKSEFRVASDS